MQKWILRKKTKNRIFSSALDSPTSVADLDLPEPVKLERTTSVTVDLGSNVGLSYPLNTKKVVLLKKGQVYPEAPKPVTVERHDDIETVAHRTPIAMEPLEGLLDEFPDSIKETLEKLLDK